MPASTIDVDFIAGEDFRVVQLTDLEIM